MFNFSKQNPDTSDPNAGYGCPACPCTPYNSYGSPNEGARRLDYAIDRTSNKSGYSVPWGTSDVDA